jgi:hypothetical protein
MRYIADWRGIKQVGWLNAKSGRDPEMRQSQVIREAVITRMECEKGRAQRDGSGLLAVCAGEARNIDRCA